MIWAVLLWWVASYLAHLLWYWIQIRDLPNWVGFRFNWVVASKYEILKYLEANLYSFKTEFLKKLYDFFVFFFLRWTLLTVCFHLIGNFLPRLHSYLKIVKLCNEAFGWFLVDKFKLSKKPIACQGEVVYSWHSKFCLKLGIVNVYLIYTLAVFFWVPLVPD